MTDCNPLSWTGSGWKMPQIRGLRLSASSGIPGRRRRRGRVAEGGGLLNRYRVVKPYRGFESLRLRHPLFSLRFGAATPPAPQVDGFGAASIAFLGTATIPISQRTGGHDLINQ
jgi:hypothetical protein